jgi:hydroxylamine reductase (hybrid-cluster protein)
MIMATSKGLRWLLDNRYAKKGGMNRFEKILEANRDSSASGRIVAISSHFEVSPTQAQRWLKDYQSFVGPLP